jgi:hypothetical protein
MVPYCDAYESAHKLDEVLKRAVELRSAGKQDEARAKVLQEGVPLWLTIAPLVRQTMVEFQSVIATRNDLGQLASMQNKLVRIALERLRLSIKEFLTELPEEMNQAYAASISPVGANPPRVFIPTRPSILRLGESLRIFINAPGHKDVVPVKLHTRRLGTQEWRMTDATHAGRNVYMAKLGPFLATDGAIEYYASAPGGPKGLTDPPRAPINVYTLNVLA